MSQYQVTYSFDDTNALKAFVDRNAGAVSGSTSPTATPEKRGPGRPPGSGAKPAAATPATPNGAKRTRAEVNAVLGELKVAHGVEDAKKLIAEIGFAKMNDITEDKFDETYARAKALLEAGPPPPPPPPPPPAVDDDI